MICPICSFETQVGMHFCGRCGFLLAKNCLVCGFANPLDYRFCAMCGSHLPIEATRPEALLPGGKSPDRPVESSPIESRSTTNGVLTLVEGERRVATVILADVRKSTDLFEKIGTEAWVSIMNNIFQLLSVEIYRFGGHVDQFRGDGLVAFFGTVVAHGDDPERGVLAALAMQHAIQALAINLAEQQNIDVKLRVGINTGEVIVASIGDSSQHRENTAMGEAVALAARMETAAEPGTVLVSENTYRLVETRFHWQPLGELELKGINHPVAVYRPLGPRTNFEAAQDLQAYGMPVAMTGREVEFRALKDAIDGLYRGRGGIVLVAGEKGMGKSLLVTQVRQHFVRQFTLNTGLSSPTANPAARGNFAPADITWLRGECRSYDQSRPYSMWLDLIYQWLAIQIDKSQEEKRGRLKSQALVLWGDSFENYYPYLARFLLIPLEEKSEDRVRFLDAEGLKKQFYLTIRSWVEAMSRLGPLVLSFSDIQWADNASLDLLRYCLPLCDTHRVIWMAIFRPERASPAWEFRHYVETEYPHRLTSVEMKPLDEVEGGQLIEQLLGGKVLSDKTLRMVIKKSEGNPYFIRELISSLSAQGVLIQDDTVGEWHEAGPIISLDLPDSLQSLLLERIDRLSGEEKRVLQIGSVMGSVFWTQVVYSLANDSGEVDISLNSLQRKGLIHELRQVPDLGLEFGFNSSLVRDVVYESMLVNQKADFHRKIASFLEDIVNLENWLQQSSLVAYHYRFAGEKRKELYYSMKTASQARELYANQEARDHLTRSLELLAELESTPETEALIDVIRSQKFEVLSERSKVNNLLACFLEAREDARALLPLSTHFTEDLHWRVDALLNQPEVINPDNQQVLAAGLEMAKEALDISRRLGDRNRELLSLAFLGGLQYLDHASSWRSIWEEALLLAEELGDDTMQVNLLLRIGSAYGMDDLATNLEYLEKAMPICEKLGDKGVEMQLLRTFAEQYERKGDYYRQLTDFEQKRLQITREIGDRIAEGDALMYCGQVQGIYLGDYESGLSQVVKSLRLWEEMSGRLFPSLRFAQIKILLGHYNEADAILESVRSLVEENIWDLARAGYFLVKMDLCNHLADEVHLTEALDIYERVSHLVGEKLISRQYQMAAACETSAVYLSLAVDKQEEAERQACREKALAASQLAYEIYQEFGFVQIAECSSEEILFRHSRSLKAQGYETEGAGFLKKAYSEMMRKHDLIPVYSPFRKTFLGRIELHKQIREDYLRTAVGEENRKAVAATQSERT